MELLLVRQLNRACSIEELGSSISGHVLELRVVELTAALTSISNTARAHALFHRTAAAATLREDLAIEEGQIIRVGAVKALIRISIRLKLIDDVLRVLATS